MGKSQSPLFAELAVGTTVPISKATATTEFAGTENPRYLRVIHSLELRARSRKEIDRIAGAANGPQLIANLRACGLAVPCRMIPGIDRDGHPIRFGVYSLDALDRKKILRWQRQRERKAREVVHGK
jgi:hypothetical protein